jgi:prepilin-type N-terminal cleavage/methylation domain-containing protein
MCSPLKIRSSASSVQRPRSHRAFTLIEMLIVISIISVLLGLLYGPLERARKFSRRAIAYAEVKNIEAALKQYYAHYHDWPPEEFITAVTSLQSGTDRGFIIDANSAMMLQGTLTATRPQAVRDANPDRIPFIEFSRMNSLGIPINPFRVTSGETASRQYKVLFDSDNDSSIQVRDSAAPSFQTNVFKSVVVWTVIPGTPVSGQNNGAQAATDEVLGSWDTFGK